jgi:flavin-dependent dehydrogenase
MAKKIKSILPDINIIGAGPSGILAAFLLAQNGFNVTIFDKNSFPRTKACGGAISMISLNIYKRYMPMFYHEITNSKESIKFDNVKINIKDKTSYTITTKGTSNNYNENYFGIIVDRKWFDNVALNFAKENQNIKIELSNKIDVNLIHNKNPKNNETITIIANGKNYFKNRPCIDTSFLGTQGFFKPKSEWTLKNFELFYLPEILPGYLWAFKLSDERLNIGAITTPEKFANLKLSSSDTLLALISKTHIKNFIDKDCLIDKTLTKMLPSYMCENQLQMTENIFFIGDSAGLINPFSGEGISNALTSAVIVAKHIISKHNHQDEKYESLIESEKNLKKQFIQDNKIRELFSNIKIIERIFSDAEIDKSKKSFIDGIFTGNRSFKDSSSFCIFRLKLKLFKYFKINLLKIPF